MEKKITQNVIQESRVIKHALTNYDRPRFVTDDKMVGIFTKHIWKPKYKTIIMKPI